MPEPAQHRPPWPDSAAELADFWSQRVARQAVNRLVATLSVIAFLAGGAVLYVVNQELLHLRARVDTEIEQQVGETIEARIDPILDEARQSIGVNVEKAGKLLAEVNDELRRIEEQRQQIQTELTQAQDASRAAADYLKSLQQQGDRAVAAVPVEPFRAESAAEPSCRSAALSPEQRAQIAIRQTVRATSESSGGRRLYENAFRVAAPSTDEPALDEALGPCLLAAVDRVAYSLNPRWFTPNRNVRTDPGNGFAYAILVWGTTAIDIEVFLIGGQERICMRGRLRAVEAADMLLHEESCDALTYAAP
jgi:hypothetical protein